MKENYLITPIDYLKGVGPNRADLIKSELKIFTYNDLLNFFPFRYIDKSKYHKINELENNNSEVQIIGKFINLKFSNNFKAKRLIGVFSDGNHEIEVVWFRAVKWIEKSIKLNNDYVLYGKVNWFNNKPSLVHPETELLEKHKKSIKSQNQRWRVGNMRLLVVEDESLLRQQLEQGLTKQGYVVDVAEDGKIGLYHATENDFDAAIIDLGLPEIDGISLIQQIRSAGKEYPILILTARGDWQDKVAGLDAGADDYVVKPFQLEEIIARLNALLRRAAGFSKPKLEFGILSLDIAAKRLLVNEESIDLTAYEYKMLEYLMLHPGQVISKTELTEHLYAQDYDRDSNVLEVFVRRLRQKLDPDQTLKPIETVRGQGYRFSLEES